MAPVGVLKGRKSISGLGTAVDRPNRAPAPKSFALHPSDYSKGLCFDEFPRVSSQKKTLWRE